MPFTISHVAAVLPFSRWLKTRHLFSAAIVGSMVPDFGMFLPIHVPRSETHSIAALARFILPMGLASYWLFQLAVKSAVIAVLPDRLYALARPYAAFADIRKLRSWLLASIGILVGALTHLVWDAFTHEGARGMRMIPALDELMIGAGGHRLGGQRLLQDVSSLIGFAIIGGWIAWAMRSAADVDVGPRPLGPAERALWLSIYGVTAVLIAITAVFLMHEAETGRIGLAAATTDAAVAGLRGLGAALVGVSLLLNLRLPR